MTPVIISIRSTSNAVLSTRPTAIKFTFTGDAPISEVRIYDANDILLSVMRSLSSGVPYSIMSSVVSKKGRPEFFVPAPVARIDFDTDFDDMPLLVVSSINFGTNNIDEQGRLVILEVADSRLTGDGLGNYIVGESNALELLVDAEGRTYYILAAQPVYVTWDGDPHVYQLDDLGQWYFINGTGVKVIVTDITYANWTNPEGDALPPESIHTTKVVLDILSNTGDWYPAFGVSEVKRKVEYGIVNMPIGKRFRGEGV